MSKIQSVEMFRYDGNLYESEEKAKQAEYDAIANYLDQRVFNSVILKPGDKIKLMNALIAYRATISELLSKE